MKMRYMSYVSVYAPIISHGWGIYRVRIDDRFDVWVCCTHNYIEGGRSYNFDLFVDYMAELPVWCFASFEQAKAWTGLHSNRYPIYRQLQLLRHRDQYWFGHIIADYLSLESAAKETMNYDFEKI